MRALTKLLALSEKEKDEGEVTAAVTAAAVVPGESSDAAISLMEAGLGSKGPDLLYDLSTSKGVPPRVQTRVKQALAKADVKGRMSPALAVAIEVRAASGCEAKHALLSRAKEHGDARVLPALRPLQVAKGCGFLALGDCWSCLHKDGALGAAIAAIEDRSAK